MFRQRVLNPAALAILLGCALFAIYWPSINGPFILDDTHTIANNSGVQSIGNITKVWSSGKYYSSLPPNWVYRPVTTLSNVLMWSVADGASWPFHALKLMLFLGICWLLFDLWQIFLPQYCKTVLFAGIFIFAVNPVHSEVLGYISASSGLIAALFVLLGLKFYLMFCQFNQKRWLLLGLSSALLAVLAKEEGVVIAALVPLTHIYLNKINNRPWHSSRFFISFLFAFVAAFGVWLTVLFYEPISEVGRGGLISWSYFITQWRAYLRYVVMYFYSYDLNADNLAFGFSKKITEPAVYTALLINLTCLAFAAWSWRRWPQWAFALAWFYIGISPASSFVVLSEPVNDHRAFMGYLGFSILLIMLLNFLWAKNKKNFYTLVLLTITIYSWQTFNRSHLWGNNELLWRDTVAKNPSSARAHNNLAVDLMAKAKYSEALGLLNQCAQLSPSYANCYMNRAVVLGALGRDQEAEMDFKRSVPLDHTQFQARNSWASFLNSRGFLERPFLLLRDADQYSNGTNLELRVHMITLLKNMGDTARARTYLNESLAYFGRQQQLVSLEQSLNMTKK